ncbi:hypothetical protein BN2537_8545 [Streptomyces venezuelae]|nr:hypothetical protein BN2537_8545 [Streptomyces venezuelae]
MSRPSNAPGAAALRKRGAPGGRHGPRSRACAARPGRAGLCPGPRRPSTVRIDW